MLFNAVACFLLVLLGILIIRYNNILGSFVIILGVSYILKAILTMVTTPVNL